MRRKDEGYTPGVTSVGWLFFAIILAIALMILAACFGPRTPAGAQPIPDQPNYIVAQFTKKDGSSGNLVRRQTFDNNAECEAFMRTENWPAHALTVIPYLDQQDWDHKAPPQFVCMTEDEYKTKYPERS